MVEITAELVRELVDKQFPQWSDLEIRPVENDGHDNRTFRLGGDMTVRLPSARKYAAQVEKEMRWLPVLGASINLPVSSPLAKGRPGVGYPFYWSVNLYIPGERAAYENISDLKAFAGDLAGFLRELQRADTEGAPAAGKHNFHRGGDLQLYNSETEEALKSLGGVLPEERLKTLWREALESSWEKEKVWVHGDIAPGNLLVEGGHLCGVIDFGIMGVGDPACDYAMAWTFFTGESRDEFLRGVDRDTVKRARGWALWKALITYDDEDIEVRENSRFTIGQILEI